MTGWLQTVRTDQPTSDSSLELELHGLSRHCSTLLPHLNQEEKSEQGVSV